MFENVDEWMYDGQMTDTKGIGTSDELINTHDGICHLFIRPASFLAKQSDQFW